MDAETLSKYQSILKKDPGSRVFAPYSDALRQAKNYAEAEKVAREGARLNPNFAGGFVALGRILLEQFKYGEAEKALKRSTELDAENILAHHLLGSVYLEAKKPQQALKCFKMVLYLNPQSEKARKAVEKLESLTADEYDDDTFSMIKLNNQPALMQVKNNESHLQASPDASVEVSRSLERYLSLIDAFIIRNSLDRASELLERAEVEFPDHPEINNRKKVLSKSTISFEEVPEIAPISSREQLVRQRKIEVLQNLLQRISESPRKTLTTSSEIY